MGLRDKFKPAKTDALKKNISTEDKSVGSSGRAGYLEISEGTNKFRILPPHPGHELFSQHVVKHWISAEKDGGEMGRKTVPNSKIHGGMKLDLFDEYMKRSKLWMEENEVEDIPEKIRAMTDWKGGIGPSHSWLMYALKVDGEERTFGLLEVGKLVRDGINNIATNEEEDEPIEVDPFTDPDSGLPIFIKHSPKAKVPRDRYEVTLGRSPKALSLTDEELEELAGKKPLSELITFTMEDLETGIEGLRFFDEDKEIGFCESDEFEKLIQEVKDELEGKGKKSKKSVGGTEKKKPVVKKAVEEDEEEETEEEDDEVEEEEDDSEEKDHLSDLTRSDLKKYIAKKSLAVRVKQSMDDNDIREAIREEEAKAKKTSTKTKPKVEEEEEEEDDDSDASLEDIKKSLRKKKG